MSKPSTIRRREAADYRTIKAIIKNPGIVAASIRSNDLPALRRLEDAGQISYRDGGWYLTPCRQHARAMYGDNECGRCGKKMK